MLLEIHVRLGRMRFVLEVPVWRTTFGLVQGEPVIRFVEWQGDDIWVVRG